MKKTVNTSFIYAGYGYVLVSDNMHSSFCIG